MRLSRRKWTSKSTRNGEDPEGNGENGGVSEESETDPEEYGEVDPEDNAEQHQEENGESP